jgi:hypothetical protein
MVDGLEKNRYKAVLQLHKIRPRSILALRLAGADEVAMNPSRRKIIHLQNCSIITLTRQPENRTHSKVLRLALNSSFQNFVWKGCGRWMKAMWEEPRRGSIFGRSIPDQHQYLLVLNSKTSGITYVTSLLTR